MAFNLNVERKESVNKCIRFPVPLMNKIETLLKDYDISFSKFVIQAWICTRRNGNKWEEKSKKLVATKVALFLWV